MAISPDLLRRAGIVLSPDRFEALVEQVVTEMPAVVSASAVADLTPEEADALQRGGLDLSLLRPDEDDPFARAAAAYAALLASSLTVQETARRLGVDGSRVRQRLAARTLYGIRHGDGWRIPVFQFDGGRLLPALAAVVSRLDPTLHPLAVFRWFTTPDPDLRTDNTPLSPRDWLRRGLSGAAARRCNWRHTLVGRVHLVGAVGPARSNRDLANGRRRLDGA